MSYLQKLIDLVIMVDADGDLSPRIDGDTYQKAQKELDELLSLHRWHTFPDEKPKATEHPQSHKYYICACEYEGNIYVLHQPLRFVRERDNFGKITRIWIDEKCNQVYRVVRWKPYPEYIQEIIVKTEK